MILLVEDDVADAERTLHALGEASAGSQVHWVKDGAEALDFLFCSGAYAERDPGHYQELLCEIVEQISDLGVLVNQLLLLAESEARDRHWRR